MEEDHEDLGPSVAPQSGAPRVEEHLGASDPTILCSGGERNHFLGCGGIAVLLLVAVAFLGLYQAAHAKHTYQRANGNFTFFFWGLSALAATTALVVYAFATSVWMARLEWAFPVRGRWLRYLACGVVVLFAVLALLLLIMQPIA